mmetsp:Transcript_130876/g.364743  ORF Transcript_130876/g.364743 Transcript_130876/m.364743 type:complete len:111 (+) Transcript_130876:92-424(+)
MQERGRQISGKRDDCLLRATNGILKGQAVAVQEVAGAPPCVRRSNYPAGILPVENQSVPNMRGLNPDLVPAPGRDPDANQAKGLSVSDGTCQRRELRARGPALPAHNAGQ